MDEPQLTEQVVESDADATKSDLNEVLNSAFESEKLENNINTDDATVSKEPSTSGDVKLSEEVSDINQAKENQPVDSTVEDAGNTQDITMEVFVDEPTGGSVEQVNFEKPNSNQMDETAQSELDNDNVEFAEESINISQLNVEAEHHDESNDAFIALKESETDALQEPKEEQKDEEQNTDTQLEESIEASGSIETDSIQVNKSMEVDAAEVLPDKTVTGEVIEEQVHVDSDSVHDAGTETADFDGNDSLGSPELHQKADNDETEEIPEEDETTENTNEGEGIDENVCLLGDETVTECESSEGVEVSEEIADDEAAEPAPDNEAQIQTAQSDVMEIDSDVTEKETEDTEEAVIDEPSQLKENEVQERSGEITEESCLNCENVAKCMYSLLEESGEIKFLCTYNCVKEHLEDNPDKYKLVQRIVIIQEIQPAENSCSKCDEKKLCSFRYQITVTSTITNEPSVPDEGGETPTEPPQPSTETVKSIDTRFLCERETCLKDFIGDNTKKYIVRELRKRSERVRSTPKPSQLEEEEEIPKVVARSDAEVETARIDRDQSFIRRCAQCFDIVNFTAKSIQWETYDFCSEKCLGQYQNLIGANCTQCNGDVASTSIGKLCVRFGPEIKQFCTSACLNVFKQTHKTCSLCFKDLKREGDEENTVVTKRSNNFCDHLCAKRYEEIIHPRKRYPQYLCSVCNNKKSPKVEVLLDGHVHRFCSNPCFSAFKFVNNVNPDQCDMCTKHFERKSCDAHTIYQGETPKIFCTNICMNVFITKNREIWQCNWCKVSKYNFDMIQLNFEKTRMCSLTCHSLHDISVNAMSRKRSKCDHCKLQKQPQYQLAMSDASTRNFCTYQCVLGFQGQFKSKAVGDVPSVIPAGTAKRIKASSTSSNFDKQPVPVISLVQSLNIRRGSRQPYNPMTNRRPGSPIPVPELTVQLERLSDLPARVKVSQLSSLTGGPSSWTPISTSRGSSPVRVEHKTQVVTIPPLPKQVGNKSTMCKSITLNKAINCVPSTAEAECQTEDWLEQRIIVPVPILVYVPQPMMMYSLPTPVAVPIPLPIPVPIFVPTTRNSASGIMKEIKKIQEKMPTDPYEAELLMMAEMVAGDKKREETDSDSEENNEIEYGDTIENNASFNEDLVQMAFKMAGNDFDDPPVDLENEMTANTISQSSNAYGDDMDPHSLQHHQLLLLQQQRDAAATMQSNRGRKRIQTPTKQPNTRSNAPNKRIKREMEVMQPEMPREPAEKPDANMCLKYTFGVNAWKQWVATKNADFEKSSIRRNPIKSEILQLTADELNYSLCMFVKEVRKPNGSEYAPDTIYYLVLGIQQYLYENGRIDNIFTDRYYEQFTDCLDEVAKKFSVLYNDSQYIVTRVEEEHLWECKQLGAHSPHVLLSTLMFFNTKHFNLVTVDEHVELSFSHIMKHWKRNPNQPGAAKVPGSRNVLLRFYPPQSSLEANSRKKKVYEQQENEENPLRCPVKLYEFFLSKCPESVKTRNDVFYLQPERSCVPDSPVWYSTQPLSRDAISKMLHRVKMVKEINIALLTS